MKWKSEGEIGAFSGFAGDGDGAAVFEGDAAGHSESEAGAAAFSGVIGVEDFVEFFGGYSGAGVDDVDDAVGGGFGDGEDEFAAVGHSLDGVEDEVEDSLFEESFIGGEGDVFRGRFESELDFLLLGLREEEVDHFFAEAVEFDVFFVEFHFTGVTEESVEDIAEAAGFAFAGSQAACQAAVRGVVVLEFFEEELEVELDGGEGVFDFVGEAACEGTEFGEAFGVFGAVDQAAHAAIGQDAGASGEGEGGDASEEQSPSEGTHGISDTGNWGGGRWEPEVME